MRVHGCVRVCMCAWVGVCGWREKSQARPQVRSHQHPPSPIPLGDKVKTRTLAPCSTPSATKTNPLIGCDTANNPTSGTHAVTTASSFVKSEGTADGGAGGGGGVSDGGGVGNGGGGDGETGEARDMLWFARHGSCSVRRAVSRGVSLGCICFAHR